MKYQLEVKQLVRFPYCRIYRSFVNSLIQDSQIRKNGKGLLFYFVALFSLANYRPAYRTLQGIRYSIQAGEWVASKAELCEHLHLKHQYQLMLLLRRLQDKHLIEVTEYPGPKLVKFRICCWKDTNTTLDYSAPCQKDLGFFFFPVALVPDLISGGKCSEADMLLDLWLNAVFNDTDVVGSEICPMVYFRNGSRLPLLCYADMAQRWSVSKSTVHRFLKKFEELEMLVTFSFPGTVGSVVCLSNYLSTMFCVADPHPDKRELSIKLHIELPEQPEASLGEVVTGLLTDVSATCQSVPKPHIRKILESVRKALFASGFYCCSCPHALYRLSNLSGWTGGNLLYDLSIECGDAGPRYFFSLALRQELFQTNVDVEVI